MTKRTFFHWATAVTLLGAAGCGIPEREENGDQEPTLGNYAVTVTLDNDQIILTPGAKEVLVRCTLKVECLSPIPPDGCGSNAPGWQHSDDGFIRVLVDNPDNPITTAGLYFDVDAYLKVFPEGDNSSGKPEGRWIRFYPTNIPKDLKLYPRGGAFAVLKLLRPGAPPTQQEQKRDKPALTAVPPLRTGFMIEPTQLFTVSYKGPRSKLIAADLGGDGAAAFGASVNGGLGFPLEGDGSGTTVTVTYLGKELRDATLTLKAQVFRDEDQAGATAVIHLTP